MDAISAMEVLTARNPVQATRNIQIRPAVPPLMRPIIDVLKDVRFLIKARAFGDAHPSMVSQLHMTNMVNPKMETNLKFLRIS